MLLAGCGGDDDDDDNDDVTVVQTASGKVSGEAAGEGDEQVYTYKGIPYGAPPVGNLRWKPPQPPASWDGVYAATKYSVMSPQTYPASPVYDGIPESGMGEDVLRLNITTPAKAKNQKQKLPVMVLFHGGGLTSGSVNRASDNRADLPNHGVVSVAVQHRIGALGYMAHPELTAESPNHASGNYGQLDLIQALKWVQSNIAAFGGDPGNVTIWGHSGGGMKTNWLVASPLSKGLFHRAISEAGWTVGGTALAQAEQYGVNLMNKVGAKNIEELRQRPWQEIIAVTDMPLAESGYATVHTVDGWSLPKTIGDLYLQDNHNDVPFMVGNGGGEINARSPDRGNFLLQMVKARKSPIYTYIFTHVPSNWAKAGVTAYHGLEVSYQYGSIDTVQRLYGTSLLPASPDIPADPGLTDDDWALTDTVMTTWAQFADTGNPNNPKLGVTWPTYSDADQYLDIGVPSILKTGFATVNTQQPPRVAE
jgi:para-nitrobenzyl esterase